jgi:hypothetical protein
MDQDKDVADIDGQQCARAAFELRMMLGNGCVDFSRILTILDRAA